MTDHNDFRSGFVAITGRPNVGKSTLLNRIVGKKIAITSSRPQTTRNRIVGVANGTGWQIAFVDTPGIHEPRSRQLNKIINRNAINSARSVDVNVLMITADGWRAEDEHVLKIVAAMDIPTVLLINKIDKLKSKELLLPLLAESSEKHDFSALIPVSAISGKGVSQLIDELVSMLPNAAMMYPDGQLTEQSDRFLLSEFLREQLFRQLGDELPYASAVTIDELVEQRLKQIGSYSRKTMEQHLGQKVYLEIWVKVKSGWSNDAQRLRELGLTEDV